jgi:hypothetical protein
MIQDPANGHSLGIALEPEGERLGRAEFQGPPETPGLDLFKRVCTRTIFCSTSVNSMGASGTIDEPR